MVKVDEADADGEAKRLVVSPVTIWMGVFPKSTSAVADDILALLTLGVRGIKPRGKIESFL